MSGTFTRTNPSGIPAPVSIANGGTGQTTAQAAIDTLLPPGTVGYVAQNVGGHVVMAAAPAASGTCATGQVTFLDSDCDTPSGWLVGDGSSVSKTTYSALYAKKKLKHNKSWITGLYTSDLTNSGYAIENGHYTTYSSSYAFNNDATSTQFASLNVYTGVNGVDYIGQDFGAGITKHIRKITIQQSSSNGITSVKVQYSSDGTSWSDLQTLTLALNTTVQTFPLNSSSSYRYWRILANAATASSGLHWSVYEIEMMESNPEQVTCTTHGFSTADAVNVWSSGTIPTGLTAESVTYYVRAVDASTLQFHPTANDATNNTNVISLTGGSGTHYIAADGTFALPNYSTTTINGIVCKYVIKT